MFEEKGKTGEPGEKPLRADKRSNNQLNPLMATRPKSNMGHVGGSQVQSPLRHPCSPKQVNVFFRLTLQEVRCYFGFTLV